MGTRGVRTTTGATTAGGRMRQPGNIIVGIATSCLVGCPMATPKDHFRPNGHQDTTIDVAPTDDAILFNASGTGGRDLYLLYLDKLKFAAYRPLVPNSPTIIAEIVNVDEPRDKVRLLLRVERPRIPTWAWTNITDGRAFQQAYTMESGTHYATMSCKELPPNEASSMDTSTPYLAASRVAKWIGPWMVNYGIGTLATSVASSALGGQVDTGSVGFTALSSIYLARRVLTYTNYLADIQGIAPIRRWNGMTGEEGPTWWDTAMATTKRAVGVGTVGLGLAAGFTYVMGDQAPMYIMTRTLAQAALAIPLSGLATTVADATIGIRTVRNPTNTKQPTKVNKDHPTDIEQDAKKSKTKPIELRSA